MRGAKFTVANVPFKPPLCNSFDRLIGSPAVSTTFNSPMRGRGRRTRLRTRRCIVRLHFLLPLRGPRLRCDEGRSMLRSGILYGDKGGVLFEGRSPYGRATRFVEDGEGEQGDRVGQHCGGGVSVGRS